MRKLTRYVLFELISVFLLSLFTLMSIIIVVTVVNEGVKQDLPLMQILALIPYTLPFALSIAVPVTLLLATTSVFSRMAGGNEIVAIKAMGISPMSFIWPVAIVGFLLSLLSVWMNDVAVSWGRAGVQRVVLEAVDEIAYSMLRSKGSYSSDQFSITVDGVDGRTLIGLVGSIGSPPNHFQADTAVLWCDHEREKLVIEATNVEFTGKISGAFHDKQVFDISLWDASNSNKRQGNPSDTALREIKGESERQLRLIDDYDREMATRAAFETLSGRFDQLTSREWETRRKMREPMVARLNKLHTEPYRRWSAGFSCLCFLWIGAPMAIRRRNSDFLTSFFLCFVPILIVYYPIMVLGLGAAKDGSVPPITVWAGNVLLLLWGWMLLRKVVRY